ncbi:PAS domain S-box-containing protein [Halorubrum aquaticum]|uniref:PAS domain S-box-containing protein n=1 Tax=Halorubrum aquaticum TaxID=387340 RepID=A0A1I3ABS4_9EURY|nr:response regulator [Halorubrum aquaticum]SFH47552.1 PAS domain S-box-containing protein [Halorubrum aquaticum]
MTDDPLRVLCVDDEPGLADLVATYLERDDGFDCETTVETDPNAALDRIRSGSFDCVVTDYDMPARTGVELLSSARETHPELPFLLFSATEPDEIAAEMVRVGVTDYVGKDGGIEAYTTLVRRVEHAVDPEPSADGKTGFDGEVDLLDEDVDLDREAVSLDGVCTVGPDGTFEYVCEEYGELYGYDPDDLVGERWQRLHPDEEVEHIRTDVLPVVMEGDRWTGRSTGLRADGSTFPESKMVSTTSDGRLLISVSEYGGSGARADD